MRALPWLLLLAAPAGFVFGQEANPAKSTGQVGQLVPGPFPSYNINGPSAKQQQCLVVKHELNPVVAIFTTSVPANADDPVGALLAKTEELIEKNKSHKLGGFAIFLTLEKDRLLDKESEKKISQLEGMVTNLKLKELTVGLEHPQAKPVSLWGIGAKDTVTVLLYRRHKVEARFAYTADKPLKAENVAEIVAAVEKLLK